MRKSILLPLSCAVMFGAPTAAWTTMTTAKEVSAIVAGKKLDSTAGRGWWIVRRAGILSGGYKDQRLKGSWRMKDGLFCFTTKLGKKERKDCAVFQKNTKDQVRLIYKSGKGAKAVYDKQ